MKRLLIMMGLLGALAVGIVAVAGAGAQEDAPTATPSAGSTEDAEAKPGQKFLDKLAENLGISRNELDTAIDDTQIDLIDEAVADGRIDQEKADELKERIANGEPLFPRFGFGPGRGPGEHRPLTRPFHWIFENAAELLGMEKDELQTELKDGKSLADIAEEKGIDLDGFKSDLLAAAKEDLDAKVAEGDLEQERADELYETFSENIDRIVSASHDFEMDLEGGREGLREQFRMHIGGDGDFGGIIGEGEAIPFGDIEPAFPFGDIESGSFPEIVPDFPTIIEESAADTDA